MFSQNVDYSLNIKVDDTSNMYVFKAIVAIAAAGFASQEAGGGFVTAVPIMETDLAETGVRVRGGLKVSALSNKFLPRTSLPNAATYSFYISTFNASRMTLPMSTYHLKLYFKIKSTLLPIRALQFKRKQKPSSSF